MVTKPKLGEIGYSPDEPVGGYPREWAGFTEAEREALRKRTQPRLPTRIRRRRPEVPPPPEVTPTPAEVSPFVSAKLPEVPLFDPEVEAFFALMEIALPDMTVGYGLTREETAYLAIENLLTMAEERPEDLLTQLRAGGRTPEGEAILTTLGATPEDIEEFFAPPEPLEIPEGGIQFFQEVEVPVEPYIGEVEEDGVIVRKLLETRPVRKPFTLMPNYTIELEGEVIGTYDPATGMITPVEFTTIQLAKRNLTVAWGEYTVGEFSWGEFGDLALGSLGVLGAYIDKYVGRPWETAVIEARSNFQKTIGLNTEMDDIALRRLQETRDKYGWAGALIAEDVSDIWHDYVEDATGPASVALNAVEWLNPAYLIPIGGVAGRAASYTSKIPILGKTLTRTAAGVQAIERGITYPVAKPLELGVRYGAKGAEAVGKRISESLANKLIKQTDNLLLEVPETERLLSGVLVDNWQKRALLYIAKLPPLRVGVEKTLGWRILLKRESMEIQDIIGRAGVAHAEISRMGTNAKAIKMWELREISTNPTKLFGLNNEGYSASLARKLRPEYIAEKKVAGTLEHIFAYPEKYVLTPKQLQYVARFHEAQTQVLNMLKAEGVPPEQVIEDWIHRVVFIEGQSKRVPRAIGKKPTYEKHRKFETMADGIEWFRTQPDLKAHYAANPELLITDYIQQAFKRIADERFVNYIAKEMGAVGKAFGVKPTEKLINFPELFEEITGKSGRELAEKAVLRYEELTAAKQFSSVMNRALRGETPHASTLAMLERKFPELGKRFREALGNKAELQAIKKEVAALTEARRVPFWEAKTERAFRMEQLRQPTLREGYIMQPFAGGKLYDREFIDAFNKFFGHQAGLPGLNVTSDAAGILRITKAALDFSFQAIQGLPSWGLAHAYMLKDPKIGLRLMGNWYKAYGESVAAFFRPEVLAKAIAKERDAAMQLVGYGGSARAIDYFQVLWAKKGLAGAFEKAAKKIPFTPYERAETAFFGAGQLVRQRFGKILMPKAIARGEEFELARFLDRITGITDSATLGVPLTVRQLEQTFMWFAPNYTRACLTVLSDIGRGGMTGAMTREAIGGMVAAGAFYYSGIQYAISTIEGQSNEQAWRTVQEGFGVVTDPITGEVNWQPTGRFMTIQVGNYYMGFGGFWYGLLRLSGNIMAAVNEVGDKERIDLVRIMKNGTLNKQDNPFVYWWFSRASPFFGTGFELATGKDFLGYPLETTEDYLKYIATRFEPIWMEQGLNWLIPGMARDAEIPEGLARQVLVPAELFGLRTFPESNWVKFYDKANELIKHIPEEELDPKQIDAWREGTLTWKQLTDIQKVNLLSRYPELEEIYGTAQADSAVRGSENWKQWQGRVEEEKTTYYSRGDGLVERLIIGDLDTRELREMWSEVGQNYGVALDVIEKEPAYTEIYGFFEDKEAKGEKYGFMDNLALQEYINIVFADYLDEKGDIDWDAKDEAVDEFIEKFGEETYLRIRQMYADKKQLEGLHPMLIRLADDKDKLSRDYWQLPYKPIFEMDEEDEKDGNIPAEYYMLWKQYQGTPDVDKEAFLETHPELTKDWRVEFRLNNPEQDAMLALWGYGGKIQSREAYDLVVQWGRELDIPFEQMGLGLPPPSLIDRYFSYNELPTGLERKWFRLENPKFETWGQETYGWSPITEQEVMPREIFKLQEKYNALPTTGKDRLIFRHENPEYENYLVTVKGYTPVGDRWQEKEVTPKPTPKPKPEPEKEEEEEPTDLEELRRKLGELLE